ncbi:hypothetical protein LCM28_09845 [Salipiger pacificus]|nr:hypothetical protein [Alloyangia pacifica]
MKRTILAALAALTITSPAAAFIVNEYSQCELTRSADRTMTGKAVRLEADLMAMLAQEPTVITKRARKAAQITVPAGSYDLARELARSVTLRAMYDDIGPRFLIGSTTLVFKGQRYDADTGKHLGEGTDMFASGTAEVILTDGGEVAEINAYAPGNGDACREANRAQLEKVQRELREIRNREDALKIWGK